MDCEFPSAEISTYKGQIDALLALKFVDQSFLLGLNSRIQSKFQTWILADFKQYHELTNAAASLATAPPNQLTTEFTTFAYFTTLWSDFHYPVIKFFQEQHAAFMLETNKQFRDSKQNGTSTAFNVKAVEIRKINENATKFAKQASQFYFILIKYFATHYLNPLLPRRLLSFFKLAPVPHGIETHDVNAQTNLLYLIHRSVLALGDISRHRAFSEVSTVIPCLSRRAYFEHRALTPQARSEAYGPRYQKAVQYYKLCILLLPALNEPYNHLGVIANHLDEKFSACLWFLRSQLTRLSNFQLGLNNLQSVLEKQFFVSELKHIDMDSWIGGTVASPIDLQNVLVCLVGYYFLPGLYRKDRTPFHRMPIATAEDTFRAATRAQFNVLLTMDTDHINFLVTQLTVLFSFVKLIETHTLNNNLLGPDELFTQVGSITFRYVDMVLDGIASVDFNSTVHCDNALITLRYILNWLVENKAMYKLCRARRSTMAALCGATNAVLRFVSEYDSDLPALVQGSTSRPVRSHYFSEDVLFRDFFVVNYQLKDFKDDHLFLPNNPDLLLGDYSSLVNVDGWPSFLPNTAVRSTIPIPQMVAAYERNSRVKCCLVLCKKLLLGNTFGLIYDPAQKVYTKDPNHADPVNPDQTLDPQAAKAATHEGSSYAAMAGGKKKQPRSKVDAPKKGPLLGSGPVEKASGPIKNPRVDHSRASIADTLNTEPVVQVANSTQEIVSQSTNSQANASSSLEEIQLFILSHTSNFGTTENDVATNKPQALDDSLREVTLEEMVDGLVDEPSTNGLRSLSPSHKDNTKMDFSHAQPMQLAYGEGVNWSNRAVPSSVTAAPAVPAVPLTSTPAMAPVQPGMPHFPVNETLGYPAGYYQGPQYPGYVNGGGPKMGPVQYPQYSAPSAYPGPAGQYGWPVQPQGYNQYMMQAPFYNGLAEPNAFTTTANPYPGYGMPPAQAQGMPPVAPVQAQGMPNMYMPPFGGAVPHGTRDPRSGTDHQPNQ